MTKQKYKAIFFDIDDTLMDHKTGTFSEKVLEMFPLLKKRGFFLGLCTSRALDELANVPDTILNEIDCLITCGGSVIKFLDAEIDFIGIDQTSVAILFEYFEKNRIVYRWSTASGNGYFGKYRNDYVENAFLKMYDMVPGYRPYKGEAITNILYYPNRVRVNEEVTQLVKDLKITTWPDATEILPTGIDKAVGIKKAIQKWKLSLSEVIAFGDGNNDLEMLKEVGYGVAMGNATFAAKEVATTITESVSDEGVYKELIRLGIL